MNRSHGVPYFETYIHIYGHTITNFFGQRQSLIRKDALINRKKVPWSIFPLPKTVNARNKISRYIENRGCVDDWFLLLSKATLFIGSAKSFRRTYVITDCINLKQIKTVHYSCIITLPKLLKLHTKRKLLYSRTFVIPTNRGTRPFGL